MTIDTTEVRSRGVITIPKSIRETNHIAEGQQYSVVSLGQGNILLTPRPSQINTMCNDLRDTLLARGATLEEMLVELRSVRENVNV